jgi:hypothetical protein
MDLVSGEDSINYTNCPYDLAEARGLLNGLLLEAKSAQSRRNRMIASAEEFLASIPGDPVS